MNDNVKSKVLTSLIWKFLERGGSQGIQFIVQIILARILMPSDYGIIALISIFIVIANVFIQSGFNTSLIQKKEVTDEDFSSVFYLSLFASVIIYLLLFFVAPYIERFYKTEGLTLVLRVLALTIILGVFNSIQNAVISRKMEFKKLFFSSLSGIVVSGSLGIVSAYAGFGVWALVIQQISNILIVTISLWFTVKWRPKMIFSFNKIKGLFSFGWKILVSALIDNIYMNLRSLIVGKVYSAEMLGFYNRGDQFPQILINNINGSIQSVMFPALSVEQGNKARVKEMVRRAIVTSSFIIFPLMIGLAMVSDAMVRVILTDKWLPCVPFIRIFCFSYALWPIHTANLQAINALGHSEIYLKLEIIKKTVGMIILLISINFGVYAIAVGLLISGIISTFINAHPNYKLLNYSYLEQVKDIMPSLILSLIMGGVVYCVGLINLSSIFILIIQILVGIVTYIGLAAVFKIECFTYLLNTVKEIINKKRGIA